MKWTDKFLAPFSKVSLQTVESFIRLETADDETTLVAEDGSLVSYLKVDGSRQIIGQEEYAHLIESSTVKMGSRFDRRGHAMQVHFSRNPSQSYQMTSSMVGPSKVAAANIGMELDDLFEEKSRHLSRFLISEECYFVLWTRPSILSKSDFERAAKENKNRKWVPAGNAQFPLAALESLRARHKSYVLGMSSALDELGIRVDLMEVHDALQAIRAGIFPERSSSKWRPCLPGDPIPARAPQTKLDFSDVLWPPLGQQISAGNCKIINDHVVQLGQHIWSGVDVTLAPMDPSPFPMLLNRLLDAKIPYRVSFLLESGGAEGSQTKSSIASILGFSNSLNKQIKNSINALQALARSEPIVKLRISLSTWAPADKLNVLEDRVSTLMQAVESWGYCQVSNVSGDPLECVMSSAMGISCASTAPTASLVLPACQQCA